MHVEQHNTLDKSNCMPMGKTQTQNEDDEERSYKLMYGDGNLISNNINYLTRHNLRHADDFGYVILSTTQTHWTLFPYPFRPLFPLPRKIIGSTLF